MANIQYVTKEGLEKLRAELHELETIERPRISQQIAEARDKGDLSENAEYDAAKHAQELLEIKIAQLEVTLSKVQVIKEEDIPTDKVYILSKVKLKNMKNNSIIEYSLVSPEESDFEKRKISVESPIGKALMGKAIGEIAEIKAPAGKISYQVLEISR